MLVHVNAIVLAPHVLDEVLEMLAKSIFAQLGELGYEPKE